ncbi:MAG TPA: TIGR02996 domain-containing protein [Kofleriaceae bacterium]|nr:TIGR02996 domain-containing protein [Kofleriaceae bacterium]
MTIANEAALLRAILDAPDDDAPRLVYADALLQAGDPRGELIALQCKRDPALQPRIDELLEAHGTAWTAELGPNLHEATFERGFPITVELRATDLDTLALAALDRAPIRNLRITIDDDLDDPADPLDVAHWLAADPRTRHLQLLDLSWLQCGDDALRAMLGADLAELRTLFFSDYDSQTHAAEAMLASPTLRQLETLALCGDSWADFSDGLALLAASDRARSLRTLALPNCGLDERAGELIGGSPHLPQLRSLDLTGGSNTTNRILDRGFAALAKLPELERIALVYNRIGGDSLALLADPTTLPRLTSLAVNSCPITADGVRALVSSPRFQTIEELWIGGCPLGDDGVAAIARSPHAVNLRALNVAGTGAAEEAVAALVESPYLDKLAYLSIRVDEGLRGKLVARFGARLAA